jgi:hypothetical protein
VKLLLGLTAGATGQVIAVPADLLKVCWSLLRQQQCITEAWLFITCTAAAA